MPEIPKKISCRTEAHARGLNEGLHNPMIAKIIMETKICLERAMTKKNTPNYNKDKVEKLIQKSLR